MPATKSYTTTPFLGMRGTGRWGQGQEPDTWRKSIFYTQPNGNTLLTGISSMVSNETAPDYMWNWHTQTLEMQGGRLAAEGNVWTDTALSVRVSSGAASGTQIYVQMLADNTSSTYEKYACANEFKKGDMVVLRHADHTNSVSPSPDTDTVAWVNGEPVINGTSSYVPMKLAQADQGDALSATSDIDATDEVYIIGSAYGEGGMPVTPINHIAQDVYNYTQIFKESYIVSGTMQSSPHRNYDDIIAHERDMAMKRFGLKTEKALIWGVRGSHVDPDTSETARTSGGLNWFMRQYAPNNFFKFHLESGSSWAGKTWLQAGEDYIDHVLEQISFTGNDDEVMAVCGNSFLTSLNSVIKNTGSNWELTNREGWYGIKVKEWVTPVKTLLIKTHPLFNHMPSLRHSALILKPGSIKVLPLPGRDMADSDVTPAGFDGYKGQFLGELGFEIHDLDQFAWIHGAGVDNIN